MKKALPYFIVLLVIFLATACSASTPTATQAPAPSGSTPGISQTGNGNQVTVTLADNTITASTTNFQAGVPYTFVITNTGKHSHNLNINPPVSTAGSIDDALNNALLAVPTSDLAPGQSVTKEFTFPDSAAGKPLEFSCLIKRHYEDGMHVNITVVK